MRLHRADVAAPDRSRERRGGIAVAEVHQRPPHQRQEQLGRRLQPGAARQPGGDIGQDHDVVRREDRRGMVARLAARRDLQRRRHLEPDRERAAHVHGPRVALEHRGRADERLRAPFRVAQRLQRMERAARRPARLQRRERAAVLASRRVEHRVARLHRAALGQPQRDRSDRVIGHGDEHHIGRGEGRLPGHRGRRERGRQRPHPAREHRHRAGTREGACERQPDAPSTHHRDRGGGHFPVISCISVSGVPPCCSSVTASRTCRSSRLRRRSSSSRPNT